MKTKGGLDIPFDLASALDAKRPDTRARRVSAIIRATVEWNERHPLKIR